MKVKKNSEHMKSKGTMKPHAEKSIQMALKARDNKKLKNKAMRKTRKRPFPKRRNLKARGTKSASLDLEAAKANAMTYHAVRPTFISPQLAQLVGGPQENGADTSITPAHEQNLIEHALNIRLHTD